MLTQHEKKTQSAAEVPGPWRGRAPRAIPIAVRSITLNASPNASLTGTTPASRPILSTYERARAAVDIAVQNC